MHEIFLTPFPFARKVCPLLIVYSNAYYVIRSDLR